MGTLKYTDFSMTLLLIAVLAMLFCKIGNRAPEISGWLIVVCAPPLITAYLWEGADRSKDLVYVVQLLTFMAIIFTTLAAHRRKQEDAQAHVVHVHAALPLLLGAILLELLSDIRPSAHHQLQELQLFLLGVGCACLFWGTMKWPTSSGYQRR